MHLNLLKVDDFIEQNNYQEVTSLKLPSKTKLYTEPTLWGANIFGRIGSSERRLTFGYIELHTKIINPPVYRLLKSLNSAISAIMDERKSFKIENGKLIEDTDNGSTGISFLIKHLDELDLEALAKTDKKKDAKFLTTNKHLITITKLIVIPAETRDLDITAANSSISEINGLYLDVMRHALSVLETGGAGDELLIRGVVKQLQWSSQQVYGWLSARLTGKKGIFRANLLKKSTDYSSRLILASSPNIPFGKIGVPWHTLIMLYDPLFFHQVKNKHPEFEKDILEFMKITQFDRVSSGLMSKFIKSANKSPGSIPKVMILQIKEILSEFMDEQVIVYKRDPALSRKSWASAVPVIIDGAISQLNSLDLGPLGGDCITGEVCLMKKDKSNNWVEQLLDISDFSNKYKTTLVSTNTRTDGIVVHEYSVDEDVYSRGINVNTGKLSVSKIHKWWIHENLDMYKVSIKKSRATSSRIDSFECSSENSLLAYNPIQKTIIAASPRDISKDSNLMLLKDNRKSYTNNNTLSSKLNEYNIVYSGSDSELGWFIGVWLGDGSILGCDRPKASTAISNCDPELHTRWADTAYKLTVVNINEYVSVIKDSDVGFFTDASRKARRTSFNDKNIKDFLIDNFGKRSAGKKIPYWALNYSSEFVKGLFAGIIDTDACAVTKYITLTSKSTELLKSLRHILSYKYSITSSMHESTNKLTSLKYGVLSTRMNLCDAAFWLSIADSVSNELTSNHIYETMDGSPRTHKVVKYMDSDCILHADYSVKSRVKKVFNTTSLNITFDKLKLNSELAINIFDQNQNNELEIIPFESLSCEKSETTTAYDFTVDPDQRSFITGSRLIVKNSDGDQILIAPLFTDEAKKAADKMNPSKSKSKWLDTNSNTKIVYSLSLDTISAIYHATKE